ncbi:hypothetical protein IAD21_03799 [Abditibacteriota bacterium]|nr:hypothetical protein IAD21_03799 [Abditibacteriota bacterium]
MTSPYLGNQVFSLDGSQRAALVGMPGEVHSFDVQVKNDATGTRQLRVKLPATPERWSMVLRDAPEGGGPITADAQSPAGWLTPELAPNEALTLRLELTPLSHPDGLRDAIVPVRVENPTGSRADVVQAAIVKERVLWMEYTLDPGASGHGDNWRVVPAGGLVVPQWSVLGMRAVRLGDQPWPNEPFKPVWRRGGEEFVGELVWFHFPTATAPGAGGEEVTVECDATPSTFVRVLPDND